MRQVGWALVLAAVLSGCSLLPTEEVERPVALVIPPEPERALFPVRRGTIQDLVRVTGRVASQREAALYFQGAGRVGQVLVKAGDQVEAGQTLASLETGDLPVRLRLAELNVRQARLKMDQIQEQMVLRGEEPLKYDLLHAEIDLERQEILYEQLRQQAEGTVLTAPFSGTLTAVDIKPGDQVQSLAVVMTLVDPAALETRMEVATDESMAKLGLNRQVTLRVITATGEAETTGTIVQMPDPTRAPRPGESNRLVRVAFDGEPPAAARMGDLVQVNAVVREATDTLIIPNATIRSFASRVYVYVVQGDAKREVDIRLGIQGETESEVLTGLAEGQQVISK